MALVCEAAFVSDGGGIFIVYSPWCCSTAREGKRTQTIKNWIKHLNSGWCRVVCKFISHKTSIHLNNVTRRGISGVEKGKTPFYS